MIMSVICWGESKSCYASLYPFKVSPTYYDVMVVVTCMYVSPSPLGGGTHTVHFPHTSLHPRQRRGLWRLGHMVHELPPHFGGSFPPPSPSPDEALPLPCYDVLIPFADLEAAESPSRGSPTVLLGPGLQPQQGTQQPAS